jgi:type VII secretion protein EccE
MATMGQPTAWPSGGGHPTDPGQAVAQSGWGSDRDGPRVPGQRGPQPPPQPAAPPPKPRRIRRRGTLLGLHSGQLVTAELAAIVLLASAAGGVAWIAVAAPIAAVLLIVAFGRIRRTWAYRWLALGARFVGRRRGLPSGADAGALLDLLRPGAVVGSVDVDGAATGYVAEPYGLTAVVELGDPGALFADATTVVTSPAELLPPGGPDSPQVRLQLLVAGVPAPALRAGSGSPATSYRQLTEGRVLGLQRAFLAVHVRRVGGFADAELRLALTSAVRRARRRLERDDVPCRPLAADTTLRVLGELAHLDPAHGLAEDWSAVAVGGLRQVTFRLRRWPDFAGELGRSLLPRLLALPGAGTTVSLATERLDADEVRVELAIRLAAPGPQSQAAAVGALRHLLGSAGAAVHRLDGTQLAGLAATLPLGGAADPGAAGLAAVLDPTAAAALVGDGGLRATTQTLTTLELPVGGAGLMLGVNRHGEPTTVRLFRPEPTRVGLYGGLRYAELLVLRALALGGQVVVQTGRPQAWEPFLRGASGPGEALTLVAANRPVDLPPATPLGPQLVVTDIGPVGAQRVPVVESAWRATVVVRDDLGPADTDILARADLVLLPSLSAPEAELAGRALGLDQLGGYLPRIRPDMMGIVGARRTLRWTMLSPTAIEQQLIGTFGG